MRSLRWALAIVLLGSVSTLRAATEAVTSLNGEHLVISELTLGWSFQADQDIVVTHLGVYDMGQWPTDKVGDGLLVSHQVGLWNSAGSTLLAVATVPSGTDAPLEASGFRYVELPATVTLTGGETYLIGASNERNISDDWARLETAAFAADIIYLEPRWRDSIGPEFGAPLESGAGDEDGHFGPGFKYDPIPEPSTALFFGLSVIGILGFRRRS